MKGKQMTEKPATIIVEKLRIGVWRETNRRIEMLSLRGKVATSKIGVSYDRKTGVRCRSSRGSGFLRTLIDPSCLPL